MEGLKGKIAGQPRAGRPPVQHIKHVHVLSLSPELEEKIDSIQETFIKGKALRAVGEAAKGVLSHPAGLIAVAGIWITVMLTIRPGALGAVVNEKGVVTGFSRSLFTAYARNIIGPIMTAAGVDMEDTEHAVEQLWDLAQQRIGRPITEFIKGLF